MTKSVFGPENSTNRRVFIGGSDARIIMGDDERALIRLWHEKRGEIEPEDLSDDLAVQLGAATEELVRAQHRPGRRRRPAPGPASGAAMDGGHAGWHG